MNRDLDMSKGKVAAQAAHGAVSLFRRGRRGPAGGPDRALLKAWDAAGQTKVCLRADGEGALLALAAAAAAAGVQTALVADAGRTQIAAGSRTVLALIGTSAQLEGVTGGLKLL